MGAIFGKRPNSARSKQPPPPQSKVTENDRVVLVSLCVESALINAVDQTLFNLLFPSIGTHFALVFLQTDLSPDFASQKLKQQRDKIKQYQKRINVQLERERDVVRKLVQENKKE